MYLGPYLSNNSSFDLSCNLIVLMTSGLSEKLKLNLSHTQKLKSMVVKEVIDVRKYR